MPNYLIITKVPGLVAKRKQSFKGCSTCEECAAVRGFFLRPEKQDLKLQINGSRRQHVIRKLQDSEANKSTSSSGEAPNMGCRWRTADPKELLPPPALVITKTANKCEDAEDARRRSRHALERVRELLEPEAKRARIQ